MNPRPVPTSRGRESQQSGPLFDDVLVASSGEVGYAVEDIVDGEYEAHALFRDLIEPDPGVPPQARHEPASGSCWASVTTGTVADMGVAAVGSLRVSEWWSGRMVRLVALACVVVAGVLTTGGLVEAAPTVERWSGADRYSTSVRVSQEAFPAGADMVFVATGESFPDALAAGPAAATLDGPILLTATNELPAVVSAELQRLAPSTVYLLGGNAAITANVESQVDAATSADVERIAGADRYSTAAAVTELAFPTADTVYVAAGTGFADALSAGAPGGLRGRPVLLTASGAVPVASRGQITRLGDPDIIVLGGTAAISNAVLAELDSLTTGSVKRVSGSDRYATSVAVSVDAFTEADTVFLATGHRVS